jgi:predicted RNase H-like nuclease
MEFFNEVTRHWLLKGKLPVEHMYTAEELDAMVAAFTAFQATRNPRSVLAIGDRDEGQIIIPTAALLPSYS